MPKEPFPADTHASSSEALQQLSHDIRSAMPELLGGVYCWSKRRLVTQAQTQIDRIRAATDTLATLVDDALLTADGETLIRNNRTEVHVAEWLMALDQRWSGCAAESGR